MCEICRMQICPPSCPTYEGKRAGSGKAIGRCAVCESLIYQGEIYFYNRDRSVCEDCARYIDTDELRELCGLSERQELLEALGFVRDGE